MAELEKHVLDGSNDEASIRLHKLLAELEKEKAEKANKNEKN